MHTHALFDLARQRHADVLDNAEKARRARLSPRRRAKLRTRVAAALTATGRAFLSAGATLGADS